MKLKYNESKHTLNQPMRTSFYWRGKKKKTKGLSPKKCYLPGKLAQPIYHLKRKKKKRKGKVKHFQVPTDQQATPNLSQKFHKRKLEENKGSRGTP